MKLIQPILFLILITFLLSSCGLFKYQYVPPAPTQDEINTSILKDSLNSILHSQLKDNYLAYSFSKLKTNKPKEFLTLDSLYKRRSDITKNKKKDSYTTNLESVNQQIKATKIVINKKKLYHTFEIEHIYIVKTKEGFTLHEDNFLFLPNYKLKERTSLLSTPLTKEEKELFDYFSLQNPLFETVDINYNNQMNQIVYDRFNNALSNEKRNKAKLIHTILYSISYIRENNSFDHEKIAEGIATKWINDYLKTNFVPKFDQIKELTENDELFAYSLTANNKKGDESITFIFDLNLVNIEKKIKK